MSASAGEPTTTSLVAATPDGIRASTWSSARRALPIAVSISPSARYGSITADWLRVIGSTAVLARRSAWAARAIAAAARTAPCASSTSTKPTPTCRGVQPAASCAGVTATGHGEPCSSRSAVEPGMTRPIRPRRVDPTTTRHASRSTAASWRTRAGDGPPRTMRSAPLSPARRSSSCSASARRSSSTLPALTALVIGSCR